MDRGVRESEMEMGLVRNEGSSEPHTDPRSEQGSMEETNALLSSNVPGKTRRSASLLSRWGSNRQPGSYIPVDSHEQGETQESGGQAGNHHEVDPGQAQIPGSDEQGEIQERPGQAENEENRGQDENQENPGQAQNEENPRQAENEETPGQAVTQGSRELYGATSRSYIRMRHKALIDQLNSYAVLLVLVAGAMSVAVLQPPGSFDTDGHIRKAAEPYLIAASMSFLFAMVGLVAVMLGFVQLFDPVF